MKRSLVLALMLLAFSIARPQISNPPIIFVSAAPSGSCADGSALRVVVSTGDLYSCQAGTWGEVGGGGGGSGTVTSVSIVTAHGVSGSVADPTTTPAITLTLGAITPSSLALNGGTTQTGTQGTDTNLLTAGMISGTAATLCTDASGGATTSGCSTGAVSSVSNSDSSLTISPTTGAVVASINLANPNIFTATQSAPAFAATSDDVHAGYLSLTGNTTAPAVVSNTAGFMGPDSASFTAYALQLPSANPSGGQELSFATPSSGVSAGSWVTGTQTICSGTVSLGTSAIASGAAASTVTATCTGLATTDTIALSFNGSPLAVTGYVPSANGMLTIMGWPTANTINVSVVNNTGSSVTPGAITLNYRVTR